MRLAVPHQPDFDWITQADPLGIEIDLHPPRLTGLGHELDIGERSADHQKRVAILYRFLRWLGSKQTDSAGGVRAVVGHCGLAQQRLDDRRAEFLAIFSSSSVASKAP